MYDDVYFMNRALQLAMRADVQSVLPNPRVGAVVVKNKRILSEGYHESFGKEHAERSALSIITPRQAKGAHLYCTLEPCFGQWKGKHHAACVDIILKYKISRVCIATLDPNPRVMGNGIRALRKRGVRVDVLEAFRETACRINEAFFALYSNGYTRPFVHLKTAQSLDAYMAAEDGSSTQLMGRKKVGITCESSRAIVHGLRAQSHAICTGVNTVIVDDPRYDIRYGHKRLAPTLVVLDSKLRTPLSATCLDVQRRTPQIIIFTTEEGYARTRKRIALEKKGVHIFTVPKNPLGQGVFIPAIFPQLIELGLLILMVEGGATVSNAFLKANVVDKVNIFIAPIFLGKYGTEQRSTKNRLCMSGVSTLSEALRLCHVRTQTVEGGNDVYVSGYTREFIPLVR